MELLWNQAEHPVAVLVLAHGAGAGMDSEFMEGMASRLSSRGISVVRFEFPYMEQRRITGKKRPPDRQPKLLERWTEVLQEVRRQVVLPVFIGGKSMGGRMATLLASQRVTAADGAKVLGVICFGYPFYAMGKKEKPRIDHLESMEIPTLVIQGYRDTMGDRPTVESYHLSRKVQVAWLEDGNHDLKPRKASGYTHEDHLDKAAQIAMEYCASIWKSRIEEGARLDYGHD